MSLPRVLEPEVMDSPEEAADYDAMDHREVNRNFVADLLAQQAHGESVLDLGTGTAQIPIELCIRDQSCRVMAVDAATHMLELARYNIEAASLIDRIQLCHADAKSLPFDNGFFAVVMSNSIVHHVPQPAAVVAEAIRVTATGGLLFFRDLMRPSSEQEVQEIVQRYAGHENRHQRQMFDDSLRAALTVDEMRRLVEQMGFPADSVTATSDRHWTWTARKPK